MTVQPLFHDEVVALRAPTQAWSSATGDMGGGVHGLHHGDWRFVRSLRFVVDESPLEPLSHEAVGSVATFTGLARHIDDETKDPRVVVQRERRVTPGRVTETIRVVNASDASIAVDMAVELGIGFAPLHSVRAGAPKAAEMTLDVEDAAVVARAGDRSLRIESSSGTVLAGDVSVGISWTLALDPGEWREAGWSAQLHDPGLVVTGADTTLPRLPAVGDAALDHWVGVALADLEAMQLATPHAPDDRFLAAGAPWYCTLFGRDSITAARMLLPVTTDLALGTLRTLAARQGTAFDSVAGEAPGKILHELRSGVYEVPREGLILPPVYFGTVDATPLWVVLLHETWRAGAPGEDIRALLPAARAALDWLRDAGDADGDGFIEYVDTSGTGLANQGWKDSADSVRWHDGRRADGPIALCEAQAYACQAALAGAELLDAYGEPGEGDAWRAYADAMRSRFRECFWVERDDQRFPAIALDGAKRPVDSLTSNIGHLLGTGLLDRAEEAEVAALLVDPRLASGWGLRTLAADEGGYWPLSYHCGSVWPHDTAIAIDGLLRAGFGDEARLLAQQLVDASLAWGGRMPELYSGESRGGALIGGTPLAGSSGAPAAYPTACRPQAWSAAAAVVARRALSG